MTIRYLTALLASAVLSTNAFSQQADSSPPSRFGIAVSGELGANPNPDRIHTLFGPQLHVWYRGWGALGLAYFGTGGDYESKLLGGALTRRLFSAGPFSATAFGGYGQYSEVGWTGVERSSPGWLIGGVAALDFGLFGLRLSASDFRGRYERSDVLEPFSFSAPRVTAGVAINAIR